MSTDRILLGRIAEAHGIRGEVLVHSFAANPADIAAYGDLTDKSGARSFRLKVLRATAKGVVCRIDGVSDRNAAEALRGTELHVSRDKLPAPSEDEFYHSDLIGLAAVAPGGEVLGRIIAVENFGAGDILEIALESNGKATGRTEMVPFADAFVPTVDVPGRRVIVRLPADGDDGDDGEPSPGAAG